MTSGGHKAPAYREPPRWQLYGQRQSQEPSCFPHPQGRRQGASPPDQQPAFSPAPASGPTPRQPPTPRQHGKRRRARDPLRRQACANILTIAGVLVVVLAIVAALRGSPATPATNAKPASAAVRSPIISRPERQFVSDMQDAFHLQSSVSSADIALFGQDICAARQGGQTQASEVTWTEQTWSNTQAGAAGEMVALAEREICPSYLSTLK
jgi:hypothetical protein